MKISVVITTKNEEKGIAKVINSIKRLRKNYEIIVVDKSTDNTAEIVKNLGVKLIKQRSDGKGNAMKEGAKFASGEVIIFIDGDGSYPVKEIPKMIRIIQTENIDFVRACRLRRWKQKKLLNLFINKLISTIASLLYAQTSDLLTGMYAIKKNRFESLQLKSAGFEIETELFIKAHKNNLKIKEIEVEYFNRIGKSKFRVLSDTLKIIRILLSNIGNKYK
jgi:glycosyltransferase involved in cell wall biosynthesis